MSEDSETQVLNAELALHETEVGNVVARAGLLL